MAIPTPATPPTPTLLTSSRKPPLIPIDLHSALTSTLRAWLAYRDMILWTICSGTDPDEDPLVLPSLSQVDDELRSMEGFHAQALDLARRIDPDGKPKETIRNAMRALLSVESPKFLLRVEGIPDAF